MTGTAGPHVLGTKGSVALVVVLLAGLLLATVDPFTMLFYVSYAAVGCLLARLRPANPIGWLLIAIGFGFVGTTPPPTIAPADLIRHVASIIVTRRLAPDQPVTIPGHHRRSIGPT